MDSSTNVVATVIGFGMSATFIIFMCTRINCGRIRGSVESRMMYEIESRIDIEQPEHHANDPEPSLYTVKFSLSVSAHAQLAPHMFLNFVLCIICLADYREREVLRIMPKCDHTFHLSCIDI
ncbi:hypothetical protein HN51_049784 [Arachis hypogaea]